MDSEAKGESPVGKQDKNMAYSLYGSQVGETDE